MAPFLTLFCGGNHEASNYLFELYYGGWIAHNIYYLGAANVVRLGPIRISGMSGIWKSYDYRKPHFERPPYNKDELHGAIHIRELDVRKLLQVRTQVDIGLSHDWPRGIESFGDFAALFRKKRGFFEDSLHGRLGNIAAREVLDRLRPAYWFSAHLHVMFAASMPHEDTTLRPIPPSANEPAAWAVEAGPVRPSTTPIKGKVSDGNASVKSSPPEIPKPSQDVSPTVDKQIAAWNSFPAEACRTEKEANELFRQQFMAAANKPRPAEEMKPIPARWKPVIRDEFGERTYGAEVIDQDAMASNKASLASKIQNDDEIDLGSSSDSNTSSPSASASATHAAKRVALTTDGAYDIGTYDGGMKTDGACDVPADKSLVDQAVADSVRNKLPASLSRPPPPVKTSRNAKHVPEAIKNKVTKFLALDKFANRDPYIQLLEIQPVSSETTEDYQRPFRLQYDKEWLAITRVFADDLHLGDPDAPVPPDLGEKEYFNLIVESEKWVEENIIKRDLLNIPYNFNRTAPKYDPKVPITTDEMPMEYNNIQTAEFCQLLGIPNKFALTEAERIHRMNVGPRPSSYGARQGGNEFRQTGYGPPKRGNRRGRRNGRGSGRGRIH